MRRYSLIVIDNLVRSDAHLNYASTRMHIISHVETCLLQNVSKATGIRSRYETVFFYTGEQGEAIDLRSIPTTYIS